MGNLFTGLIIVLLIIVGIFGVNKRMEEEKIFMESCKQDKKQYECEVMWAQKMQGRDISTAILISGVSR